MRPSAVPFLAVLALVLAGCGGSDFFPKPPTPLPSTTVAADMMVHKAVGTRPEATPLPAAFGVAPQFSTVATAFTGAEPSIGVSSSGAVFAAAYETIVRSTDGGKTWQAVHKAPGGQDFDPMLWVDPVTDRIFATHINPAKTCRTIAISDDDGASWVDQPLVCPATAIGQVDHQKLATGPFAGPQGAVSGAGVYPNLVTLCYNDSGSTHCAASLDGGHSFLQDTSVDGLQQPVSLPIPLPSQLTDVVGGCGGLNGHQHHSADGTIFVPYGYECKQSRIATSKDGGVTWTRRAPGQDEVELDPAITTTPDGTAYYVYRATDNLVYMLRSHDLFASTEGPFLVSPPEVKSAVFTTVVAGSDGRIAVAYLGTTQTAAGPDSAPSNAVWNLYIGMSLDAAATEPTFVTVRVSPASDPVQRGSICMTLPCKNDDRNLLDFIDLEMGPDGRPWLAYADGCTSAMCIRGGQLDTSTSRGDTMSVAWLSRGPSLLADHDPLAAP